MSRTNYGLPGIYNASPITLSSGVGSALAVDVNGKIIVSGTGGTGASATQVQGAAADNTPGVGNPVRVGTIYNSSVQTYASGDIADLQADLNGNLLINMATRLDPVNDTVTANEGAWYVTTITSATTTVVAAFPCYIKRVKTIGFGVAGNTTVYNDVSATGTAVIPATLQVVNASLIEDATIFSVGCTVVTTGTSPVVAVWWRPQ